MSRSFYAIHILDGPKYDARIYQDFPMRCGDIRRGHILVCRYRRTTQSVYRLSADCGELR